MFRLFVLLACVGWAVGPSASARPPRALAQASTVQIVLSERSENAGALPLQDMVRGLCADFGLVAGADPADVALVLEVSIENLGRPYVASTGKPELRWDPPPTSYLEYRGARVRGSVDFGGERFRFDGIVPPPFEAPEEVAPERPDLQVVNLYAGNALVESRMLEKLAFLLGRIYGPERLMHAQLDREWLVADAAVAALDRLEPGWPERPWARAWVPELTRWLWAGSDAQRRHARELLDRIEPGWLSGEAFRQQVPQLIAAAVGWDSWRAAEARALLSEVSDPVTAELLVPLLDHRDPRVRTLPYKVLTRLRDPRVIEPLITFAQADTSQGWTTWDVGEWSPMVAITTLGDLGDPRAFELLMAMIDDPVKGLPVIEALGRLGDARAVDVLLSIVSARDVTDHGRARAVAAATALAALGERRAVEPILEKLSCWDNDDHVYGVEGRAMLDALVALGDARASAPLAEKARSCHSTATWAQVSYLSALATFEGEEIEELLRSYAKRWRYSDPGVVRAAREALRQRRAHPPS